MTLDWSARPRAALHGEVGAPRRGRPPLVLTLHRIEKGDPGVAIGNFTIVLFVLGLTDRLAAVADPGADTVGRTLEEERLPRRIRRSRSTPPKEPPAP